jgi:hypothetical protein
MKAGSYGADDAGLKEIEFSASVHLPLDEFEFAVLSLGLAI